MSIPTDLSTERRICSAPAQNGTKLTVNEEMQLAVVGQLSGRRFACSCVLPLSSVKSVKIIPAGADGKAERSRRQWN